MNTDLFIVTFKRDFVYLDYCLRSMIRYASGFRALVILVPNPDLPELQRLIIPKLAEMPFRLVVRGYDEWPEKGMLHHEYQVICADQWTDADVICHLDADCVFYEPVTPEWFAPEGKPFMRFEPYQSIMLRRPDHGLWCDVTRRCLPFDDIVDTMRCHPNCYTRPTYQRAREAIRQKTGQDAGEYIWAQQNKFPQGFCEYVTMGNVALKYFRNDYTVVQQDGVHLVPDNRLAQFWSHAPMTESQHIWVKGSFLSMPPIEFCNNLKL